MRPERLQQHGPPKGASVVGGQRQAHGGEQPRQVELRQSRYEYRPAETAAAQLRAQKIQGDEDQRRPDGQPFPTPILDETAFPEARHHFAPEWKNEPNIIKPRYFYWKPEIEDGPEIAHTASR